jgi:putative drug exporter of the RND superfamily
MAAADSGRTSAASSASSRRRGFADSVFTAIGSFTVRFRWLVLVVWVVGALAAYTLLPSLASVTQASNAKFLPASAPSAHAAVLAAPFGTAYLTSVPVVAARSGAPLTPADVTALAALQSRLRAVSRVSTVQDLGRSADGQAEQLVVLARPSGAKNATASLVDGLRAAIGRAGLPAWLHAHLAGDVAVQADQQKASGSTGNQVEMLSALFIIVLLVIIFRSLTLALATVAPAFISVVIAGPLVAEAAHHGVQVSSIVQLLMIVLMLGAGTDYGLFLVFRVREELRAAGHSEQGERYPGSRGLGGSVYSDLAHARTPARQAITRSVTRVGESITASAATVIVAVLTLLLASFPFYSNMAVPFTIAIAVILLAGLTLLPALLSIRLSLLAVKRATFRAAFGKPKLLPWSIQATGKTGVWGRLAGRIVRHPAPTLTAGLVLFGALALGVLGYAGTGFGGTTAPPAGSDSAAGNALLARHFPQSAANPTSLIFTFGAPVWNNPAPLAAATSRLRASSLFTQVTGPLNPTGAALSPAQYAALHARFGPERALPPAPPAGATVPAAAYQAYRATANYVSPDGKTVQYAVGLTAGDPGGTAALNAVKAIRATTAATARSIHATDFGVGGTAPALYDISEISDSDLVRIIPIAIAAIGVLLAIVLRSLVAPLYLIASVGISYLATLGLSVLVFMKIGGQDGLVFFMPFMLFIFLLALGEDYNILVMSRIREEARKLPLRDAVTRALRATGTTVTSAGLVLAGSFIVLTFVAGGSGPGGQQVRNIGAGLALGILLDTFLVRTLLVPSTVVLLGRWNWWPSKMSRISADRPTDQAPVPAEGQTLPLASHETS